MCSVSSPNSSLSRLLSQSLRLHTLSVTLAATIAQNWLLLLSGQPQKRRIRTPLLRLTNELRRLTPQPPSNEPRHKLWLVR